MIEIKTIIRYEDFVTVIMNNILGETNRTAKCKKAFDNYLKIVENVIKEGMDEGLFHNGDPEGIACGIVGVTFSSLLYRLKQNRTINAEQIYKGYVETVVRGITK